MPIQVRYSDLERRDLYRALNLRAKLNNGQAYLQVRRTSKNHPGGDFPNDVRSKIVDIRLTVNDYRICVAHRYVHLDGREYLEPDPKSIRIDALELIQE